MKKARDREKWFDKVLRREKEMQKAATWNRMRCLDYNKWYKWIK